jgi:predicted ATP-dependent protease
MVFWRNRPAKKAETPVVADAEGAREAAKAVAQVQERAPQTNVVTLVTSRLADRLAGVAGFAERGEAQSSKEPAKAKEPKEPQEPREAGELVARTSIKPAEQPHFFGQKRAVAKIRAALAAKPGQHLLVLGEPGTGRLDLALALAQEVSRQPADDWIYVIERHASSRAKAFALPPGEGAAFVREVREAIDKASAAFERHVKSDEHRISIDLLEEEMRYRGESAVEHVRRRAEAQNIAVVKSLDGYVLAPMHEGRVVRSDVFRALPEALKRNVEAKITALEEELQSIVATIPDVEFEAGEKYGALIRQTALRAIRPSLTPLKKLCAETASAVAALDAIEDAFLASAATSAASAGSFAPITVVDCGLHNQFAGGEDHGVAMARTTSAADLVGEIGRDARGQPTLLPGHLMRAGSGFVIMEAWRLAADPQAWLALSAAVATKEITPLSGPGIAVKADPVPLAATVILIADDQSWSKLEAIEPGIARHFPHVAKLAATVPVADLSEEEFGRGAAWLAAGRDLKPLHPSVAPLIYKDAVQRGGGRVSLAGTALLHLLQDADSVAEAHSASQIRVSDVNEALAHRADGAMP